MRFGIAAAVAALTCLSVPAFAQTALPTQEGDFVAKSFKFENGEMMADLRLHYTTLGTRKTDAAGRTTNAVLMLHGTTGTGKNYLLPTLAGELFGPGQPLDIQKYYIILPDGIGRGGSSKPSDGLKAKFPHYDYTDLVVAQYRLVTEGLGVDHLRAIVGTSMGGMHSWIWGERYPDMMDGILAVASQPVAVTGRNFLWRNLIMETIKGDPDYKGGEYTTQPQHFQTSLPLFNIMTGNARSMEIGKTKEDAKAYYDKVVADQRKAIDANDYLYWFDAIRTYDPEPDLPKIKAKVLAVNFADDLLNPVQLGAMERAIPKVPNGSFVIVPEGPGTIGHQTLTLAKVWGPYLKQLLDSLPSS